MTVYDVTDDCRRKESGEDDDSRHDEDEHAVADVIFRGS